MEPIHLYAMAIGGCLVALGFILGVSLSIRMLRYFEEHADDQTPEESES